MAYIKLNSINDTPSTKTQLTQEWMEKYVIAHGTAEQIQRYLAFIEDTENNYAEKTNNLTKAKIRAIKLPELRKLFCEMFFPQLNEEKKKKKTTANKPKETTVDRLRKALETKAGE